MRTPHDSSAHRTKVWRNNSTGIEGGALADLLVTRQGRSALPTRGLLDQSLPEPNQRTRRHAHLARKDAGEVRLICESSFGCRMGQAAFLLDCASRGP